MADARIGLFCIAAAALTWSWACDGESGGDARADLVHAIRVSEDARDTSATALAPIREGLRHPDGEVRALAARALGRFERPGLIRDLTPLLDDPDPDVRVQAADAVGQAGHVQGWRAAWDVLRAGLETEEDPRVRAVYGQTMGRLPFDDPAAQAAAEATLMALLHELGGGGTPGWDPDRTLSLVRGFESLARLGSSLRPLDDATRDTLGSLVAGPLGAASGADSATDLSLRRIRRTALLALSAPGLAVDPPVLAEALSDPDGEVRRIAARALTGLADPDSLLDTALADPAPRVRFEAVRVAAGRRDEGCGPLVEAVDDPDLHVSIQALDELATPCSDEAEQVAALARVAESDPPPDGPWQRWAHAVAGLAGLRAREAGPAVSRLARHPSPFARAWAARAAGAAGDRPTLEALADDPHHNVREAALQELATLVGHEADPIAIRELASEDGQLVRTAARVLEGSPARDAAVPALLESLSGLTATGRETSRDPRLAVLERLAELGGPADAEAVRPLLRDFDPRIAALAATTLDDWTGEQAVPEPRVHARAPVPTPDVLERLSRSSVVLEMESGGEIEIALLPQVAPTNAGRFARLAAEGYYDGLTFHRVAPNFVIQGGSPGANEYWGDGPFTRDEVSLLGNWRGAVGLSTRGRDTGDAQLYVNVVDNLRLDHDFTVFGRVVRGMDVVDRVLEGEVIARARVVEGR